MEDSWQERGRCSKARLSRPPERYAAPEALTMRAERISPDVEFDFTAGSPDRPCSGVPGDRDRTAKLCSRRGSPPHEFAIQDGLLVRFKAYRYRSEALVAVRLSE